MLKFKDKLKNALEHFEPSAAEEVLEEINNAETDGYQLSTQESRLYDRLVRCIDSYNKTSSLLD